MELSLNIKDILRKIEFINKYQELSNNHLHELSEMMNDYNNDEVLAVFKELGIKAKYSKKENFFKVVKKHNDIKFQFNISIRYGVCEMIWALWINENIEPLGPWSLLTRLIDEKQQSIKPPSFTSYDELSQIIVEAFNLYNLFKRELLTELEGKNI